MVGFGLYGWRHAVRGGNEEAALRNLETITIIEKQYYSTHNRNFGTFDQLVAESMLGERFRGDAPVVDGYVYTLRVTPASAGKTASFTLSADPETRIRATSIFMLMIRAERSTSIQIDLLMLMIRHTCYESLAE